MNVLKEKSKENKGMHAMSLRKCRFLLAVQMFAVSVTQKGLDYFVLILRIDQLQAHSDS